MTPRMRLQRAVILGTSALAFLAVTWGLPRASLGQGAANAVDLLTAAPFDKLTLNDGNVLFIDPVLPRPLPVYDPAKEEKKKRAKREIPAEGNIGFPGEKSKVKMPDDEQEELASVLTIHLLQGDVRDFTVKRTNIKSIEYFEDMLLAEGEKLMLARDFTRAFECYLKVRARDASWRGLDDHVNRLLFAEGSAALLDGDGERGLRLLGELSARKPDFPGLADKLAASYGSRAARAFELGLYAKGRKILHDVEPLAPNHPVHREVRERFIARAKELAEAASKKQGAERLDAWTEALRVWPTLEGADAAYREAFAAEPTLDVAVTDVPRGVGPWVRSPADERITRLLYLPVLSHDDEEALQGKAAGQLAASVTSTDLGRRIVLQLRPDVTWSDGSRPVASIDVTRTLIDATDPSSPRFSARWSDLLDRVETPDETHVEIRLTRAFLKPVAWLLGPVGPAHSGDDGRVTTIGRGRELVGDGVFRFSASGSDRALLRSAESSTGQPQVKIRRIKEVRYPNVRQTLGALSRGEVAAVEHVPPDRVAEIAANPEFQVGRYARPRVHRIALDGRNPALRNRTLRRALSYAIDRRTLLEETLLHHSSDAVNLVADGVFPKGNYADAHAVKPLGHDPLLARMLVAAARKELGGQPIKLTLEYPALPEAQAVVPRLVDAFRLAGVEVVVSEKPESELEAELRAGRKFDLAYRATRCDEPVMDVGPMIAPAYDAAPGTNPLASVASPRILQLLLQLERAPEWPSAKGLAIQIDRECRDELPVLPLWQIEDHYAWRTRLKGPKDVTDQLYEGVASWEIEPWFAKDPW
jgi:peptide/nickel transport system substrate-binding protein